MRVNNPSHDPLMAEAMAGREEARKTMARKSTRCPPSLAKR
jgi:hypothetical protein